MDSIWIKDTQIPEFPRLQEDLKVDVLIVGGGLAGILCACRLARDGVSYALIEADRILNGVSGNTTAKITSQHGLIYSKLLERFGPDTARLYWQANEDARKAYGTLARELDCDYETKAHGVYSTGSVEPLLREMEALDTLGIPAQWADRLPLPFEVTGAVRFPGQAQFHPGKFAAALVKDMRIYEGTRALEFVGNRVRTEHGTVTASKIIVATHFPLINKHGGYFLKLYQQRSYVVALENAQGVEGMYLDCRQNGLSFRNYQDLLLIGGGGHRTGKQGGGWAELEAFAADRYPHARQVCRWAAQDCMTLDDIPYIGQYSRATPHLYVATGFQKWGMTSSMVAAMVLGDLVQDRENMYASVYSPRRTVLRPQLFSNVLESAVNLLTPTKPRCPHLGCALKWNRQEHSWDCPCHGSRFSEDGKLLDNPATGDMKRGKTDPGRESF